MTSNFTSKFNQNNSPDIGKVIDVSLTIFKKTIWVSGAAVFLMCLFLIPISLFTVFFSLDISSLDDLVKMTPKLENNFNYLLINAAVGIPVAGIMAIFAAGFYKINHLANNNQDFSFSSVFFYFKSPQLMHLFTAGVLTALYTNILSLGLIYLNFQFVATLIQMFISFLFILSIPLIIFENQSALSAMSNSSKLAIKHPFSIILCIAFAFLIALLGFFAFCIGFLFTIAYLYTMIYTLYNEIIPIDNTNPIDEIGKE